MGSLKKLLIGAVLAGSTLAATGCVSSLGVADPGVYQDGGGFHVASTSGATGGGAMPIYSSGDLQHWSQTGWVLRPGNYPGWADPSKGFWAPQLYYFSANGAHKYEAFYAAINRLSGHRCIGRAYSAGLDNFVDDGHPLCVPDGSYSVIDPSIFYDSSSGIHYLLYKDDLPSDRRIVIRSIDNHGNLQTVGPPHQILHATQGWETGGWSSVEAPTMIRRGGTYYLFYSGAGYSTDNYGVGVAQSGSPIGGFSKYGGNPILSGDRDPSYCGVGGQDVTSDGSLIFYHAYKSQSGEGCTGGRYLAGDTISWSGGWPHVGDGTP